MRKVVHEGHTMYADLAKGEVRFGGDMTLVHEAVGVSKARADQLTAAVLRQARRQEARHAG